MEQLTPVDNNDLERAVDLLTNFGSHWEACGDDTEAQSALIKQIVERVYVEDQQVVAMTLHSNCHLVLGHNVNGPTEYTVDPFLTDTHSGKSVYTCGDDGKTVQRQLLRNSSQLRISVESRASSSFRIRRNNTPT
jgi:hypothetical protein